MVLVARHLSTEFGVAYGFSGSRLGSVTSCSKSKQGVELAPAPSGHELVGSGYRIVGDHALVATVGLNSFGEVLAHAGEDSHGIALRALTVEHQSFQGPAGMGVGAREVPDRSVWLVLQR